MMYGSGVSFELACAMDRERIVHALNGEVVCGEEEGRGFIYCKADKEEAEKFILSAYDEAVYQARQAFAAGRAMERIFVEHNGAFGGEVFRRFRELMYEEFYGEEVPEEEEDE